MSEFRPSITQVLYARENMQDPSVLNEWREAVGDPALADFMLKGPTKTQLDYVKDNSQGNPSIVEEFDSAFGKGAAKYYTDAQSYGLLDYAQDVVKAPGDAIMAGARGVVKGGLNAVGLLNPEWQPSIDEFNKAISPTEDFKSIPDTVGEVGGQIVLPAGALTKGLQGAGMAARFAVPVAEFVTGAAVLSPNDKNITAHLLTDPEHPATQALADILATNPDDPDYANRMRNGVENLLALRVTESGIRSVIAFVRGLRGEAREVTEQTINRVLAEQEVDGVVSNEVRAEAQQGVVQAPEGLPGTPGSPEVPPSLPGAAQALPDARVPEGLPITPEAANARRAASEDALFSVGQVDETASLATRGEVGGTDEFTNLMYQVFSDEAGKLNKEFNTIRTTAENQASARVLLDDIGSILSRGNEQELYDYLMRPYASNDDIISRQAAVRSAVAARSRQLADVVTEIRRAESIGDTEWVASVTQQHDRYLADLLNLHVIDREIYGSLFGLLGKARQHAVDDAVTLAAKAREGKTVEGASQAPAKTAEAPKAPTSTQAPPEPAKVRPTKPDDRMAYIQELRQMGVSVTEAYQLAEQLAPQVGQGTTKVGIFSKITNAILEYRGAALLSGPKTFEKNFVGQLINNYLHPAYLAMGGNAEMRQLARDKLVGMHMTFADTMRAARLAFKSEHDVLSGKEFEKGMTAKISSEYLFDKQAETLLEKTVDVAGRIIRLPYRALGFTDQMFKQMAYKGEIVAQSMKEARAANLGEAETQALIQKRLQEAFKAPGAASDTLAATAAKDYSERVTFTKDFDKESPYLFERGAAVGQNILSSIPLLRWFQPYYRTPVRLLEEGIRLTPGANLTMKRFRDDLFGANGAEAQAVARGQTAFGVGLAGSWFGLAEMGVVTGGNPKDYRIGREKGEIVPPYSIKVGDKWYSYDGYEPLSFVLKSYADLSHNLNKVGDDLDRGALKEDSAFKAYTAAVITAFASSTINPTFMEGIEQLVQVVHGVTTGDENAVERFGKQSAQSMVPNLLRKIKDATDPTVRESASVFESLKAAFPFASESVAPSRNIIGEERQRDWVNGMWLAAGKDESTDPVMQELVNVMEKSGKPLAFPSKNLFGEDLREVRSADGKTTLYDRWQKIAGDDTLVRAGRADKPLREALSNLFASPEYQRAQEQEKYGFKGMEGAASKMVTDLLGGYRNAAKYYLIETDKNMKTLSDRFLQQRQENLTIQ